MHAEQAISHARDVRNRLRYPSNAKPDLGIDLKRKPPIITVVPISLADAFGPKLPHPDEIFGPRVAPPSPVSMATIITAVAKALGVSRMEMMSVRRQAELSYARHIAMYLCQTLTTKSYPEIGRGIGGRNHSTIIHGVRTIQGALCAGHLETIRIVDTLTERFRGRE